MITVLLYGELGKLFGKVHRYDISTAAEAIQALSTTIPGFKQYFVSDNKKYRISRAGKEILTLNDIHHPQSIKETVRIIPYIEGSGGGGGGGLLGAVLGVALMAATGGLASLGISGITGLAGTAFGTALGSIGMAMALGGVAQMLFAPDMPTAQSLEAPENRPSFSFNGAVNTVTQGNPVPLCYGRLIVGSQVISAGLYTADYIPT